MITRGFAGEALSASRLRFKTVVDVETLGFVRVRVVVVGGLAGSGARTDFLRDDTDAAGAGLGGGYNHLGFRFARFEEDRDYLGQIDCSDGSCRLCLLWSLDISTSRVRFRSYSRYPTGHLFQGGLCRAR